MTTDKFYDEFKICPVCLNRFYRPRACSPAGWAGRVNCSSACRGKYLTALAAGQHLTVPDPEPSRREPDPTWRDRAACLGLDPDVFFPLSNDWKGRADIGKVLEAKAICARCPSRQACLDDAIESKDAWSIRGGLTPQERSHLPERAVAS
jgi:WhiB family redox-sensing transcriptional regulator